MFQHYIDSTSNVAKKKNQLLGDFSYFMVKAVKAPDTFNLIVGHINLSFLLLDEIQLDWKI